MEGETVWLNQAQMAELFGTKRQAITKHLQNIYDCDELRFRGIAEWNKAIQKMIDAFELLKHITSFNKEEEKTIEEGLDLFRKHFRNLWD